MNDARDARAYACDAIAEMWSLVFESVPYWREQDPLRNTLVAPTAAAVLSFDVGLGLVHLARLTLHLECEILNSSTPGGQDLLVCVEIRRAWNTRLYLYRLVDFLSGKRAVTESRTALHKPCKGKKYC